MKCQRDNCVKKVKVKGFCKMHYDLYRLKNNLGKRKCSIDGCDRTHSGKGYCKSHYMKYCIGYDKMYEERKQRALTLRQKLLDKFGKICVCCGENKMEFLTIDHINNDGFSHRKNKKTGKTMDHLIIWKDIIDNGNHDNFQTLCMNCNWAKNLYGECPHVTCKEY